jgi:hypothetical protein
MQAANRQHVVESRTFELTEQWLREQYGLGEDWRLTDAKVTVPAMDNVCRVRFERTP